MDLTPVWAASIRRYSMDFERALFQVELIDGTTLVDRLPANPLGVGLASRQVTVHVAARELTLVTRRGQEITLELGASGSRDLPPADRPIVYLDQLHWVTLAQQLWSPHKVADRDRSAADELLSLARAQQIIVPFSAGHLIETAPTGSWREDLVHTMFELSRGWQMRNPVDVRRREMVAALTGDQPTSQEVFTLEPDVLWVEPSAPPKSPPDLPLDWQDLHRRLTTVSAVYASMIEPTAGPTGGREQAQAWAISHHELASYMRDEVMSKERARLVTRGRLIGDLRAELAAAAESAKIDEGSFGRWLEHGMEADLPRMPYLGRLYEVLYERLRNAQDKWVANDLFDMHFVCCGAGYADLVVTEKKTAALLRRVSKRVTNDAAYVAPTLSAALAHLSAS